MHKKAGQKESKGVTNPCETSLHLRALFQETEESGEDFAEAIAQVSGDEEEKAERKKPKGGRKPASAAAEKNDGQEAMRSRPRSAR